MTQEQETGRRRRGFVYPAIATSLMSQVDQVVESAMDELDMPKYSSRNQFVESAVRALIFKERRKTA